MVAAGSFCATAVLSLNGDDGFGRFFGRVPPLVVVGAATIIGAGSLRVLADRGWYQVPRRGEPEVAPEGVRWAVVAGVGLSLVAVAFDNLVPFPQEMNVPWPQSTLLYPAIAFVAEVAFHLVPLALLVLALGWRFEPRSDDRRVWVAVGVVACLEALFHTVDALSGSDQRLAWFVGPHLLVVGAVELVIFRRFGFMAMMIFRLTYYLVWHIAWGYLRLRLA